eukprot:1161661-Pelagomonas_calceolata.AAC.7
MADNQQEGLDTQSSVLSMTCSLEGHKTSLQSQEGLSTDPNLSSVTCSHKRHNKSHKRHKRVACHMQPQTAQGLPAKSSCGKRSSTTVLLCSSSCVAVAAAAAAAAAAATDADCSPCNSAKYQGFLFHRRELSFICRMRLDHMNWMT